MGYTPAPVPEACDSPLKGSLPSHYTGKEPGEFAVLGSLFSPWSDSLYGPFGVCIHHYHARVWYDIGASALL